jgi:hypothetical protein
MMAAALLKQLGASGFVSNAILSADGKVISPKGCTVNNVKKEDGKLSFDRLDECLPFPIPDDARVVLPLDPTILELSQYLLTVTGLNGGEYVVKINDQVVATLTGEQLGKGVNLTAFAKGPLAAQGKRILAAVTAKEGLVGQYRGQARFAASKGTLAEAKERLETLAKKIEAADEKIRQAARPRKLHFELEPAK